ncbi:MAG: alpha/beta hydrolase [Candidatus Binatia bacterium]
MTGIDLSGGGRFGCLLLHGLTGTTEEVEPLAKRFHERGWAVAAPLLPGHGTRVEDLRRATLGDWFGAALAAWDRLGTRAGESRFVAGVSMGGLLTLHLAHERAREVAAIAVLAPALALVSQRSAEIALRLARLPWLPPFLEITPKGRTDRVTAAYDRIATRAVGELVKLQRIVRTELPDIHVPTLILEGALDQTVAAGTAAAIERALGAPVKRRRIFDDGRHVLTEGSCAPAVLDEVEAFFRGAIS